MLTDEQKKERLLGIGGSDVGYIAGLSKYKSPLDLYLIKIGEIEDEEIDNEAIRWGNKLEPIVAAEYAERHGVEIFKPEKAIVHSEYYWMRCNLDFVVKDSRIVGEVKTTGFLGGDWGEELTEDIPYPFLLQCAHNAIVSEHLYNTERVDLPVLSGGIGGLKQKLYRYHRNKKLEDSVINMEREFWQEHVEQRLPPIPRNIKEAGILWPGRDGQVIIANDNHLKLYDSIKEIQQKIKELGDQEDKLKLDLIKEMDKNSELREDERWLARWRKETRKRLDQKALKTKRPDIYQEFLVTTESDVLRLA